MITLNQYLEAYHHYPEYSQPYDGQDNDKQLIKEYNKNLCAKYPWLIPTNRFTGARIKKYDFEYTELDAMPSGWRIAFGEQMCEELNQALLDENFIDKFSILEIKEKYGGLRFYINGAPKKIFEIVDKYEMISYNTCIRCGEPATWQTCGWINPFCDSCKNELEQSDEIHDRFVLISKEDD